MATRSAKEVELLGNGAGWASEFWLKLTRAIAERGGIVEDVRTLATKPEGEALIQQMAELAVPPERWILGEWIRTVNYGLSLRQMVDSIADLYENLHREEVERFVIERQNVSGSMQVDFDAVLVKFNGVPPKDAEEVEAFLRSQDLRPARIEELLAFAAGLDDDLLDELGLDELLIVALGSQISGPVLRPNRPVIARVKKPDGSHYNYLGVITDWPEEVWDENVSFLAVRRHTDGTAARHLQEIEQAQ